MKNAIAVSLLVTLATVAGSGAFVASPAYAQKVSNKVGVPLKAAQEAANKGRYPEALAKLKEAESAPGKTSSDQAKIDEMYGFVYMRQRNYNAAANLYERIGGSSPDKLKLLAQLYFQTSPPDLKKSADYANRYLKVAGNDSNMQFLLGQIQYRQQNYKGAVASIKKAVGGGTPTSNQLNYLLDSYSKLGDTQGVTDTTMQMVRLYPTKENWQRLTLNLKKQASEDRTKLHVYRLMYELDLITRSEDYSDAAIAAILYGRPGEAAKIVERGFATKVLETSGDKARSIRIRNDANRKATEQQAALAKLEQAATADATGKLDVEVGEILLSYGQTDKAIAAARRALEKKTADADDANLLLGRALMRSGKGAEARKAFDAVKGSDVKQIARLWSIRAVQT